MLNSKKTRIIVILLAFALLSSYALAVPQLPASYYGTSKINDRNVPVGSVITAEINGIQKGTVTTTSEGKYGGPLLDDGKLVVYGEESGDSVTFFVQTPEMSNKIQAMTTETFQPGDVKQFDLTFTGTEIPKTSAPSNQPSPSGGGGGGGSSGGAITGSTISASNNTNTTAKNDNPVKPTVQTTPSGVQVEVYNLDDVFSSSDTTILTLNKGDIVQFTLDKTQQSITLTSIGPGEVLLTAGSQTISLKASESKDIDVDGDGKNDISVKLSSSSENKAKLSFKRYFEPQQVSPATSFAIASPQSMAIAGVIIVIIIVVAIILKVKKKKPKVNVIEKTEKKQTARKKK